jgi:hypothetical protein
MDKNTGQKNSPAYRLAALDPDFLLGDSMRGVRLQLEYEKAEERLRAWVVRSTIVVFGSARVRPRGNSHKAESKSSLTKGQLEPTPSFVHLPTSRGQRYYRLPSPNAQQIHLA